MKETIKANDLRIGNFVLDRGNKILTIDRFWGNKIECDIKGMPDKSESGIQVYFHPFTEDIDYLIPIPLTEEWLLKFGFVTSEKLWDSFSRSNYYLSKKGELCFNLYESKNIFYMYEYRHIEYVHQLQNLYFALTGEELTIKEQ